MRIALCFIVLFLNGFLCFAEENYLFNFKKELGFEHIWELQKQEANFKKLGLETLQVDIFGTDYKIYNNRKMFGAKPTLVLMKFVRDSVVQYNIFFKLDKKVKDIIAYFSKPEKKCKFGTRTVGFDISGVYNKGMILHYSNAEVELIFPKDLSDDDSFYFSITPTTIPNPYFSRPDSCSWIMEKEFGFKLYSKADDFIENLNIKQNNVNADSVNYYVKRFVIDFKSDSLRNVSFNQDSNGIVNNIHFDCSLLKLKKLVAQILEGLQYEIKINPEIKAVEFHFDDIMLAVSSDSHNKFFKCNFSDNTWRKMIDLLEKGYEQEAKEKKKRK